MSYSFGEKNKNLTLICIAKFLGGWSGGDREGLSIYSVLVCCRGVIALKGAGLKLLFYKY